MDLHRGNHGLDYGGTNYADNCQFPFSRGWPFGENKKKV